MLSSVSQKAEVISTAPANASPATETPPATTPENTAANDDAASRMLGSAIASVTAPNAPFTAPFTPSMTPTMLDEPMAPIILATPFGKALHMLENDVLMPPVAAFACSEKLVMPSAPFLSRSTTASAKSETVTLPSFMAW